MSVNNAVQFIRHITADRDFRRACCVCDTKQELYDFLSKTNEEFWPEEFDVAFDMVHVKCETIEQADEIMQARVLYSFFR